MDIACLKCGDRPAGSNRQRVVGRPASTAGAGDQPPQPTSATSPEPDRVRSLLPLLAASRKPKGRDTRPASDGVPTAEAGASAALIAFPQRPKASAPRPLRVLHVVDGPGGLGRMVISGRMADVCAEIDRLAACEARRMRCC